MENKIKLITALLLAEKEFKAVKKTSENPYFKSKYADLNEILDAVKPALNKNGLLITQLVKNDAEKISVETILFHNSGEYLNTESSFYIKGIDIQKVGGAITYLRRYALQAMLNLAAEDDDGNDIISDNGKEEILARAREIKKYLDDNQKKHYQDIAVKKDFSILDYRDESKMLEELEKIAYEKSLAEGVK
jgi:hypothetical protein